MKEIICLALRNWVNQFFLRLGDSFNFPNLKKSRFR